MQPRRAIPSSVRQGWDGSPQQVEGVLTQWLNAVKTESGGAFDLGRYLDHAHETEDEEGNDRERSIGPIEAAFQGLVDLAATINRDGLTNPITVAPLDEMYQLETGERRWLAYHLLQAYFPGGKWEKIPARVVDAPNLWRQAAENNARDNLNAIGKARQYALLLMDLLSNDAKTRIQFKPFDTFENEREYYAQVADMAVPKGKNEMILSVMGVEHRNASSRYKALLNLPDEVWHLADDLNWPERRLRPLTAMGARDSIKIAEQWAGLADAHQVEKDLFVESERDLQRIQRRFKNLSKSERLKLAEQFEELARMLRQ
jgi:hypothetical protein